MDPTVLDQVTLAVLAGGAGSRMGIPKSRLMIAGKPVLQFLLEKIAWPGPTLLVTAPAYEHPPGAGRFDREVSDDVPAEGPLRGIRTALENSTTDTLVVIAVDMLRVERGDLRWYVERLDLLGVMGQRNGAIEPLPLALRKSAIDLVHEHLASGERSVRGLSNDSRIQIVDANELPERVWWNANTAAEWETFIGTLHDSA